MSDAPERLVVSFVLDAAHFVEEERYQEFLVRVVDELFQLEPGVREHFSDELIGELKEEISRDDTEFSAACRNAIMEVEQRWRNAQ